MRPRENNAEIEAILSEVVANRLTEEEAYSRIRALPQSAGTPKAAAGPFCASFGFDDPLLRDHQLFGRRILMGVAHCSLALEAAAARLGRPAAWRMEKVSFQEAVQGEPGQTVDVAVELKGIGDAWSFSSAYRRGASGDRRTAATGRLRPMSAGEPGTEEVESLLKRAPRVEDGSLFYSRHAEYGPSLRTLRRAFHGEDAVIGEFELPVGAHAQDRPFAAPPAFFDSAYIVSLCAAGADALGGDLWVPLFVREIELHVPVPGRWFCRTWLLKCNEEVLVTDHEFYGATGLRLGFLRGMTVKRVRTPAALGLAESPDSEPPARQDPPVGARVPAAPATLPEGGNDSGDALPTLVEGYLRVRIGAIANAAPEEVSVELPFLELGAKSASLIAMVNSMEKEMGIELYPTLFFEYQTIRELSAYLAGEHRAELSVFFAAKSPPVPSPSPARAAAAASSGRPSKPRADAREGDIAIIGMSGRFAGSRNLSELWGHVRDGTDLVGEIPADHWDYRPWFDPRPRRKLRTNCRWGSFLPDIDKFDSKFFHMSPGEADAMDPQARHLLEVLYETTEDAGYAARIWGTRTGMYVGVCFREYWDEIMRQRVPVTALESLTGAMSFLANRPSYFFDLRGPSVPVDDACSSSLVALHLACKALQRGECEMAFASGINVLLSPLHYVYFSALGQLSPTGRCHSFSKRADGYVPGEGIVSVLLKPLDRAIQDGDNIHAVVKGSAINHGGRANSITAPRTQLQTEVLCSAWNDAKIAPETLGYLEAHGTGTLLGDPVEVDALNRAFRQFTDKTGFCALGTVKANLGHTEAAAGLAGVVKAILSMKHGTIPAMCGFSEPNPYLQLEGSALYINAENQAWPAPADHPRRAGVSSFGMGGAYAHVVVEDYADRRPSAAGDGPHLFVLSARTDARLKGGVDRFRRFLEGDGVGCPAQDLCHSLQVGRQAMDSRLAVVFREMSELREALSDYSEGRDARSGTFAGHPGPRAEQPQPAALKAWWDGRQLDRLAEAWANGADVAWADLPSRAPARRIPLPFYAFEQRSHWLAPTGREGPEWGPGDRLHALIDRVVPSLQGAEFRKAFRGDEPFLRDNTIFGEQLLPGVVHLEMALAAAAELGRGPVAGLSDVAWRRPLAFGAEGGESRILFTEAGAVRWSLLSSGEAHTTGNVEFSEAAAPGIAPSIDLDAIRARCAEVLEGSEVYSRFARLGAEYGDSLRPITKIWTGATEALAVLEGTPDGGAETTRMLAGLVQASIAFCRAPHTREDACLPVSAESIRVFRAPAQRCHAYVREVVPPARGREGVFDMVLADEAGAVVAQFLGVRLQPMAGPVPQVPGAQDCAPAADGPPGRAAAEAYLAAIIAGPFKVPAEAIRPTEPFDRLGINSVTVNELNVVLEKTFGPVSRTLFFEFRNLRDLTAYFCREHGLRERVPDGAVGREGPQSRDKGANGTHAANGENGAGAHGTPPLDGGRLGALARTELAGVPGAAGADAQIAIIGVSGRFPRAADMGVFWENLSGGRDCITEIPRERWDFSKEYDPDPSREGSVYLKWGGFIDGFDRFDPLFFKISPQEAGEMDPQERLFLEVSYAALEDAGYTPEGLRQASAERRGKDVGVFVGVMWGEHQLYAAQAADPATPILRSGYWSVANRVSSCLDFKGPSMAVDTACSSSLTAIHLACESLLRGHCRAALAGGVNLSLHPNKYRQLCQLRFGSTDGRCRSFGEGGDGYVPGEGVCALLLKPLAAALADGDHIHAVIKATGCNHGGNTSGYTVPNPNAQAALIADVLERSGVAPRTISFVEAHGTGTSLGDPIEITGLSHAFREFTDERQFCPIGSAKSNIGHLEAAAGVAGVAKVLLQMRHRKLAPSLHCEVVNPNIRFEQTPFYLQRGLAEWNRPVVGGVEYPRRAAVSSFGAGGANAHLILEEHLVPRPGARGAAEPEVIVVSARDAGQLGEKAARLRAFLGRSDDWDLAEVAHTLQAGREAMASRLAFVAGDRHDLVARLDEFARGDEGRLHVGNAGDAMAAAADRNGAAHAGQDRRLGALESAATAWSRGESVDWALLRPGSARPRRTPLPTHPFDGGSYWMPRVIAEADKRRPPVGLTAGAPGGVPEASGGIHYATAWSEAPEGRSDGGRSGCATAPASGACLVVFDTAGDLARELSRAASQAGESVRIVLVRPTEGDPVEAEDGFMINPGREDDFGWLMLRLKSLGLVPTRLALAWNFRAPAPDYAGGGTPGQLAARACAGLEALFCVAGALVRNFFDRPLSLLYLVRESDGLADPAEVAVSGFIRSLRLESPRYLARSVQVDERSMGERELGDLVWSELNTASDQAEIRYCGGRRWARRIVAAAAEGPEEAPGAPFRERGVYLLTGGLGELGFLVSCFLAERFRARLVLVGRSELDAGRRQRIATIESLGGQVLYACADICAAVPLGAALERGRARFGPLDGVLHLACLVDDALVFRKNREGFRRVLGPKVAGTLALDQATRSDPLHFFISFSSAVSMLGNAGQGDYAAGCRFQDAFAETRNRLVAEGRRHGRSLTVGWSQWVQAGHTAPRDYLEARGLVALDVATGLQALLSCWRRPDAHSLVLDGHPGKIRSLLGIEAAPSDGAPGPAEPSSDPGRMSEAQVDEELLRLLGDDGAVAALGRLFPGAVAALAPAPAAQPPAASQRRAQPEGDVAAVIEEALAIRLKLSLRPEDRSKPFTDFGLDSINAVKLGAHLQDRLGVEVTPALFWEHPNIAALASRLAREQGKGVPK
jgi:acyl transferase domain-containing protein/acyl carrier protein